jgi:hypothetical protein
MNAPVVRRFDPWPQYEIYAAVGKFRHRDGHCRIVQDPVIGGDESLQFLADLVEIVVVADADHEVHSAFVVRGVVCDRCTHDLAVRHDDLLVVAGLQHRRQYLDLFDRTGYAGAFDEVAHLVRTKQYDKDTRSKVCERTLQCKADGETCSADQGDQ